MMCRLGFIFIFAVLVGCASSPPDDTFYGDPQKYWEGNADPNAFDNFVVERRMKKRPNSNDLPFYYKHCQEAGHDHFSMRSYDCAAVGY